MLSCIINVVTLRLCLRFIFWMTSVKSRLRRRAKCYITQQRAIFLSLLIISNYLRIIEKNLQKMKLITLLFFHVSFVTFSMLFVRSELYSRGLRKKKEDLRYTRISEGERT